MKSAIVAVDKIGRDHALTLVQTLGTEGELAKALTTNEFDGPIIEFMMTRRVVWYSDG